VGKSKLQITFEGQHKRDLFPNSIKSMDSPNIVFLKNLLVWLDNWNQIEIQDQKKDSRCAKLTRKCLALHYLNYNYISQSFVKQIKF
jgi:hypothetical protein